MDKEQRYIVPERAFKHFLALVEEKQQAEQAIANIDRQASMLFNIYQELLNVPKGYVLNMDGEFTEPEAKEK